MAHMGSKGPPARMLGHRMNIASKSFPSQNSVQIGANSA